MCHGNEEWCKIWWEIDLSFQNYIRNLTNFDRALKPLKKFHFNGVLLSKVYNFWAKKVQRSYVSWHWRVMQNLEKNWHAVWKMTWRIWQIFTRALESLKIGTLMGSFYPKLKMFQLKSYRRVILWQWRIMQILKRNWLVFSKLAWAIWQILTQALKSLKIWTLLGSFWTKYIMFQLKKCRKVMFDGTEDWCKSWRKTDLCFPKWREEFGKFSQAEK